MFELNDKLGTRSLKHLNLLIDRLAIATKVAAVREQTYRIMQLIPIEVID